ncbi:MAG: SOS response-associated peptidase [Proteobacteria bacterium]|nr:SOS response-associated peptidase [Pseudomonadota bacterium]
MCVQFMIRKSLDEIGVHFRAAIPAPFEFRDHVFPRYPAPVVGWSEGRRVVKPYFYGLIPHFEKNPKPKLILHNARVETLHEKPSFKEAFASRRCLIPMESFLEYVEGPDGKKRLVRFHRDQGEWLVAAGLFSLWRSPSGEPVPTFTMITREPTPFIRETGHDRSPFFLDSSEWDSWIEPGRKEPQELYGILSRGGIEFDLKADQN